MMQHMATRFHASHVGFADWIGVAYTNAVDAVPEIQIGRSIMHWYSAAEVG